MQKRYLMILISAVLIATGIFGRLIDHPANFVPLTAIVIVSGFYLQSKYSWLVPLSALLISDVIIGLYDWRIMAFVYGAYALTYIMSRLVSRSSSKSVLVPTTLFASLIFFSLSNFAVWAFSPLYSQDFSGLMMSYYMAIPFFKWSLLSDILYTGIFVAIIESAQAFATASQPAHFFENESGITES